MTEDRRLYDLEDEGDWVDAAYLLVLERQADPGGRDYYAGELRAGRLSCRDVFEQLRGSDEGQGLSTAVKYPVEQILTGFEAVFPADTFLPFVSDTPVETPRLCECADPRRWLDPQWTRYLSELELSPLPELMHRKGYEWAQTMYGLEHLGMLDERARCLGVGSGHEAILYWLANRAGEVVATDLYEGDWAARGALEGDPEVLEDPDKYAPFAYRRDRLRFLRMDGRQLDFPDNSFDVVFSLGSIEHFGGVQEAGRAMREQARVCRPGGVVVVATELILNDRDHEEFFTLDQLRDHVVAASGMKLVQAPSFELPARAVADPCVMPTQRNRRPHLVLDFDGVVTTSVILFLRHE